MFRLCLNMVLTWNYHKTIHLTEAKRLNARASVLVQKRVAVIDVWRRNRKKCVEKTAKPTWTSVWQNAGKKTPEISELNAFHWNSIFIFLLILDVLFFPLGVFIWHSGQSIECKGQCPCPVCDCSKPRTVCQTNGNSFPGVKCYDPCRLFIVYHVLESWQRILILPINQLTEKLSEITLIAIIRLKH